MFQPVSARAPTSRTCRVRAARMHRRRHRSSVPSGSVDTQIICWTLRTLARLGIRHAEPNRAPYNFDLLRTLGVSMPPSAATDEPHDGATVHGAIVARLEALEAAGVEPCSALENARLLGELLRLGEVEVAVLALTIA